MEKRKNQKLEKKLLMGNKNEKPKQVYVKILFPNDYITEHCLELTGSEDEIIKYLQQVYCEHELASFRKVEKNVTNYYPLQKLDVNNYEYYIALFFS